MPQTRTPPTSSAGAGAAPAALVLGVGSVALGMAWIAVGLVGPLGLVVLLLAVAILSLYRLVVRSTHSLQTRAWAREVGAVVLSLGLAFALWVETIAVGLVLEVVPFLGEGHYPWADAWMAIGTIGSALSVPLWWWLLRRWADPGLAIPRGTAATY